jgi:hypothetical protein
MAPTLQASALPAYKCGANIGAENADASAAREKEKKALDGATP